MNLTLVKKVDEARATKSFFFKPQVKINWQTGQYIVIKLNNLERQFTIASSPTEGELLQITVRLKEGSKFKKLLDELEIGTEVEASGPFGNFIFTHNSSFINHVFLAGGIGITPFRSMIKYNIDQKVSVPIYLIYSNSDSDFVFKKELDQWQKENEFLKIEYVDTSEAGHINSLKIEKLIKNWKLEIKNCAFSAVGPNMFVNAMEDILEELKIPEGNIKTEKFTGY